MASWLVQPSFHVGDALTGCAVALASTGPIVLMMTQTGMIWRLMRNCEPIIRGLQRAGFEGGWLRGM